MLWAGRIFSALPVLLLLFSGTMKLLRLAPVVDGFEHFGYPVGVILGIGDPFRKACGRPQAYSALHLYSACRLRA